MGRPLPQDREGRPITPPSPQEVKARPRAGYVTQERRYRLITPLFGGGVEPGVNDEVTPVSGKAVRGHLRFWWRATRGGRFGGDLAAMRRAEEQLFGAASKEDDPRPSKVQIVVDNGSGIQGGQKETPYDDRGRATDGWKELAYAAFPLQDNPQTVARGVTFNLSMSFPCEAEDDINAALWAWETFGGLGARTRRGFGSLRLAGLKINGEDTEPDLPANASVVTNWITERMQNKYQVAGQWPKGVPHLLSLGDIQSWIKITRGGKARGGDPPSARDIWQHLIQLLKNFRQARYDRNVGKHQPNKYGLSHWPEANEIRRRMRGVRNAGGDAVRKFPRAHFGLPINFHLPREEGSPSFILKGEESERWASPLILRPLACADNTGVGLALILGPAELPGDPLTLTGLPAGEKVDATLTPAEAAQIYPLHRNVDVLKAFLAVIK